MAAGSQFIRTLDLVSFDAPTHEVNVLLTVLAGSLLLNEGKLRQSLAWATVILLGMALLVSTAR